MRRLGVGVLGFGLSGMWAQGCKEFGAGGETDAAAPQGDGATPLQPQRDGGTVETAPTLGIDKTVEIRRGGTVLVKLTLGGVKKEEGPANIEAEFSPRVDGLTFGAMNVDAESGTGTIELKATATAKTSPTELKVRVALRGGRVTNAGTTKVDVFGKPGELDETFGVGGMVVEELPVRGMAVTDAAVDSTGNIYVAGHNAPDALIRKFDANGRPVVAFGENGTLRLSLFQTDSSSRVGSILVRADGLIDLHTYGDPLSPVSPMGAYAAFVPTTGLPAIASGPEDCRIAGPFRDPRFTIRLCSTDPGWNVFAREATSGRYAEWGSGASTSGNGLPLGYLAGDTHDYVFSTTLEAATSERKVLVTRLTKDRAIDTTFGVNGEARITLLDSSFRYYGSVFGPARTVYVAGANDPDPVLFRLNQDTGAFDEVFGFKRLTMAAIRTEEAPRGFVTTDNGLYWLGTSTSALQGWALAVVKYNLDGSVATDFGVGGVLRVQVAPLTSTQNLAIRLLDSGGKRLTLVGYHRDNAGSNRRGVSLARVWR